MTEKIQSWLQIASPKITIKVYCDLKKCTRIRKSLRDDKDWITVDEMLENETFKLMKL